MVITFLYTLSGGMLAVLATGHPAQMAWRFLRLAVLIAFALLCGVTVWRVFYDWPLPDARTASTFWLGCGGAAAAVLAVLAAPVSHRHPLLFRTLLMVGAIPALTAAVIAVLPDAHITWARGWIITAAQLLAAFLVGSITVAWLLGHAYLTATRMTIAPLRHFSRLLSLAVTLRIAFVALSALLAWRFEPQADVSILTTLQGAWLVVTLRAVVGLLAVGVFTYMVVDCVRLRSTQSATGILYFGSVCAYIGELASQQLVLQYGWPL